MNKNNKYYRARIVVIDNKFLELSKLLRSADIDDLPRIEQEIRILHKGFWNTQLYGNIEQFIEEEEQNNNYIDSPLSFIELCSYSTYFEINKNKVAGTYKTTTSMIFPIIIIGGKEKINETINNSLFTVTEKTVENAIDKYKEKLKLLTIKSLTI